MSTARHQHRVLRTAQTRTKLAEAAQNLSIIYTRKQEEYFSKLADEVEQEAIEGRHAAAWATINTITGRKRPQKYIIPADSPQDRVNQWRDHFQQLLTAADPTEPFIPQSIAAEDLDIDTGSITIAELQVAARTLRNRKCPVHFTRTFEANWHSRDHSPHSQPGLRHWANSSGMETVRTVTSLQER